MSKKESTYQLVNDKTILDLLYGDKDYFNKFVIASLESFNEFIENYNASILNNNLKVLRDAGHKIKPAALMMNLDKLLEMYEVSKEHMESGQTDQMEAVVQEMNAYCNQIHADLNNMLNQ